MSVGNRPRAVTIPLVYALVSAAWIIGSDALVAHAMPSFGPQTVKGLLFVLATAVMLQGLVHRHDARLEDAMRRSFANERMQCLGELAARVSHDFNNVLMALKSLLPLLQKHSDGSAEAGQVIDQIRKAERRGERLVGEILAFSTSRDPIYESIPLAVWLRDRAQELATILGPNVTITTAVTPETLEVEADEMQLQRALSNLVVNASEAMEQAGTVIIEARADAERNAVAISVTDSGPGITAAVAERIFEPLVTTKRTGTGLGLAIVRSVVEEHRGAVHFHSTPGEGTTFHVLIPARQRSGRPVDLRCLAMSPNTWS